MKKRLFLAFKNINLFLKSNYVSKIEILFVDDGSKDLETKWCVIFFAK